MVEFCICWKKNNNAKRIEFIVSEIDLNCKGRRFNYNTFKDIKPIFVLQYAKDGNFRTYKIISKNWFEKLKLKCSRYNKGFMLYANENIIHRDLHSNNVMVHKGKLSKPLDANSHSFERGMCLYLDIDYLRDHKTHKGIETSDIYD
ncbi:hypothetical protein Glove_232g109 [Diversispora epigaea]|uniref:Protein kinase domain-containing protein n=1 Tax=Diversispora epigaea TaxID=1348612 RepID=A0A397IJK7_9GLOM|nr:hypothetical protein Glove_232g109 [Diversispora epigaea]